MKEMVGLPGGKIENNENIIETLIRGVKEELNITIGNFKILLVKKYLFRKQEIIVIVYNSKIINEDPSQSFFRKFRL